MALSGPKSCDTFVVLPDKTKDGVVIFGKNSDRPSGEVQEVIYQPAADHAEGDVVQCTYIEIPQVAHTEAVILSKPSWMWGAEMGSNGKGVCVGNEAVWTNALDGEDEKVERLLGMDMVRLSLERSTTASEAVTVLTGLLETHGQGGCCSDTEPGLVYHNSFLVADPTEAWVLETASNLWVAERITEGYRNISNCLSIGTAFDRSSNNIREAAKEKDYWDGAGDFNFTKALSSGADTSRKVWGEKLLQDFTKEGQFGLRHMLRVLRDDRTGICMCDGDFVSTGSQSMRAEVAELAEQAIPCASGSFSLRDMLNVLRHEPSNICRPCDHDHPTTGSMVSVLTAPGGSNGPSCHWFTGTPNPQRSVFKPFVFTPNVRISPYIQSPAIDNDPAKTVPRFSRPVDRSHLLYRRQQAATQAGGADTAATLRQIEDQCIEETTACLASLTDDSLKEVDDLFKDCVDSELKFYK